MLFYIFRLNFIFLPIYATFSLIQNEIMFFILNWKYYVYSLIQFIRFFLHKEVFQPKFLLKINLFEFHILSIIIFTFKLCLFILFNLLLNFQFVNLINQF